MAQNTIDTLKDESRSVSTEIIPSFQPFYIENVLIGKFFHDENFGRKDIPIDYTRPDGQHYSFIAGDYTLNHDNNDGETFIVIGYYDNAGKRIEKTARENDPEEMNALLSSITDKKLKDELVRALITYESKRERYGTEKDNLRDLMRGIIGESTDTAKVTGNAEIDVHASDTSHYVACGFRYDAKEKDYIVSAYRGYPYEDDKDVIREIAIKDMDVEDVKSLLDSGVIAKAQRQEIPYKKTSVITFLEDDSPFYKVRTKRNADAADVTIAFAVDFTTAGEKCTKNVAGEKYVAVNLPSSDYYRNPESAGNKSLLKDCVERLEAGIIQISDKYGFSPSKVRINVAGNGIYTLRQHGISQEIVDRFVTDVFSLMGSRPNVHISSIRSGGQTGLDEAGIKAAAALGIPATVLAPQGWKFRSVDGIDISDEKAFKARFPVSPTIGKDVANERKEDSATLDEFHRKAKAAVASGKLKSVGELKDGWALVQAPNGKYNYADAEGKFMTKNWLDSASEFKDGKATVTRGGTVATINTEGICIAAKAEKTLHK